MSLLIASGNQVHHLQKVIEALNELDNNTERDKQVSKLTDLKIEKAIRIALTVHQEHWIRWKAGLLVVAAFGEYPFGCLVARFILGETEQCQPDGFKPQDVDLNIAGGVVYSPIQECNVQIDDFINFLCDNMSVLDAAKTRNKLYERWHTQLWVVATGVDIWGDSYANI